MPSIICNDFNLGHTLASGQFFRFEKSGRWYYIIARQKVFRARQQGRKLFFEGASAGFVRHFFGLDKNFAAVKRQLQKDRVLAIAVRKYSGLRIIRQDPWECCVAFLCSQCSSISKIRKNLECIAESFGTHTFFRGRKFYLFPGPGKINSIAKLKKCGVGYRAEYILALNKKADCAWLSKLADLPYEQAKRNLLSLPGIGEKVCECILLFSLGFSQAFPVDVWMQRVIKEEYGLNVSLRKMNEFGKRQWDNLAGYAQQYLYHWKRLQSKIVK